MRLRVLAFSACALVLLPACGKSSSDSKSDAATSAATSVPATSAPESASATDTLSATGTAADSGTAMAADCPPPSDTAASDTAASSTAEVEVDPAKRTLPAVEVPAAAPTELVTVDIVDGSGPKAAEGSDVTLNYVVALQCNGEVIDNSYEGGEPVTFTLGSGQVIPGFDEGLMGVQAGTRRQIDIPSDLAYGPTGREPIPPNAALTFIVDVITVTEPPPPPTVPPQADPADCPATDGSATPKKTFEAYPPFCIDVKAKYTAKVSTSKGDYTVELFADKAPLTVNNFVVLARYHYFDGVPCHRIISGFMAQCGDPTGTGSGGPGYEFADELPQDGEYKIGSLAMANGGPGTNGSQFFVITGQQGVSLPADYSLFGQVTEGLDSTLPALDAMGDPSAPNGVPPKEPVTIKSITITETK